MNALDHLTNKKHEVRIALRKNGKLSFQRVSHVHRA